MSEHATTPFHAQEIAIQEKLELAHLVSQYAGKMIYRTMPEQHQTFFNQLPFVMLGLTDKQGRPWAFPLFGEAGFISADSDTRLSFKQLPALDALLDLNFVQGAKIALLGIELDSRRRNRMNGHIEHISAQGFCISVEQSFGNCPQYIHKRQLHWQPTPPIFKITKDHHALIQTQGLSPQAKCLIEQADTFFIASRSQSLDQDWRHGLDVSHRGGETGFVKVEGNTLLFPDYRGNRFFNTLGNIESDGRVGLVFLDFHQGDAAFITGRAKILWQHSLMATDKKAERVIQVEIEHSLYLKDFMPMQEY